MHVDVFFTEAERDPMPPGLRTLWLGSPVIRQDKLAAALAALRGTLPWWHPFADGRAAVEAEACVGVSMMLMPGTHDGTARRDIARGWLWAAANMKCPAARFNMASEVLLEWASAEPRRALRDLRSEILRWLALAAPDLSTNSGVAAVLDMEAKLAAARRASRLPTAANDNGVAAANDNLPLAPEDDGGGFASVPLITLWRLPPAASRKAALDAARLLSLTMRAHGAPLPRRLAEEALAGTDPGVYDEVLDLLEDAPDRRAATNWRWVAASLGSPRQRVLLLRDLSNALSFAVQAGDGREADALGDLCMLWIAQPLDDELGIAGHLHRQGMAEEAIRRARPRLPDLRRHLGNA